MTDKEKFNRLSNSIFALEQLRNSYIVLTAKEIDQAIELLKKERQELVDNNKKELICQR